MPTSTLNGYRCRDCPSFLFRTRRDALAHQGRMHRRHGDAAERRVETSWREEA